MGMHIGLICAKTTVPELRAAFSRTWSKFETVASIDNLPDTNALQAWKKQHEKFVSAANWSNENPGREVFEFWQDGAWAIMFDPSYVLASDEENLAKLSIEFGQVLSFVVESASGCADFWCFKNGKLSRSINNNDTQVSSQGESLSEEAGIDLSNYYIAETEALWKAFGMSPFEVMNSANGCHAICVIDRTDYSHLAQHRPRPVVSSLAPKKPWWRFW